MFTAVLRAAAIAAALAAAAVPAAAGGYTSFWTLGDSLSDPGNLYAATGGQRPASPYYNGRFSNGSVWAEHVAGDFSARGLATGNVAFGGARTAGGDSPDLARQIDLFAGASAGRLGARPVATLWFGSNDLISQGIPAGEARKTGRAAADRVAAGALALSRLGVRDVVLFNLPDLSQTPYYRLVEPQNAAKARRGTLAFNRTLDRRADDLRKAGLKVTEIDTYRLFKALVDDPTRFGVADATTPCHVPGRFTCDLATEAPLLAFFDPLHPNATIHRAIADQVRGAVSPVPLPAPALLLLAGIGALVLVARRPRQGIGA
jgi:outer membrane lipase/esterase